MKIICRIKGGLGNQLFQLAFALKFSSLNNLPVVYEIGSFRKDTFGRRSLLNLLDPNLKIISNEFFQELIQKKNYKINESNLKLQDLEINNLIIDKNSIIKDNNYIILSGYWQDSRIIDENISKYFKSILLNYLKLKNTNQLHDIITNTENAIAIHIRRVDYAHHGVVDENVYLDIAEQLLINYPDGKIFVFSDEPNYAYHLFSKEKIPFHIINSGSEICDLALMSLCKIFLISNSTFSFWGAILSNYRNVLYPDPWSYIHIPSKHLIPKDWVKLPNTVKYFKRKKSMYDLSL